VSAVKLGFIGIGHIAIHSHLPPIGELAKSGDVEIKAFCDVNEQSAREQAEVYGVENVYTDHHEMFEKEELDGVYLCIPPTLHDDVETICAEKGIALFIEKPQTLDIQQAVGFRDAIEKGGIVSQVGFMSRYYASSETVEGLLKERTPRHAQIQLFYTGTPARFWTSRMDLCGGTFVENTIHYVDLLRYFLGDIKSVSAFYVDRKPEEGPPPMDLPHVYNVNYMFESGVTANATTSRVLTNVKVSRREILVVSDDSMILWNTNQAIENEEPVGTREEGNVAFAKQAQAFVKAVRAKDPKMVKSPYGDALNSLAAVLGANASAASGGKVIDLNEMVGA
jgi:myo-inositol 2-dehydrogenase / D-chiro-inositol 1-dehydrogenase